MEERDGVIEHEDLDTQQLALDLGGRGGRSLAPDVCLPHAGPPAQAAVTRHRPQGHRGAQGIPVLQHGRVRWGRRGERTQTHSRSRYPGSYTSARTRNSNNLKWPAITSQDCLVVEYNAFSETISLRACSFSLQLFL